MKTKKGLAITIIGTIMTLLLSSGCGNTESAFSVSQVSNSSGSKATESQSSLADSSNADEDMANITVMGMVLADMPGKQAVEDAINEITEKKINTHVTLDWIPVGQYSDQVSLNMSANEGADLLMVTPINASSFSALISQNQLIALDDMIDQYGTGIKEIAGNYLKGAQINGKTYAVPSYRTLNSDGYIVMRKDILDSLGLTEKAENMSSWSEYEDILKQVVAANPGLSGVSSNNGAGTIITNGGFFSGPDAFTDDTAYDTLGDTYNIIAADYGTDKAMSYFETDQFYQMIKRVKEWYDNGLVYKDSATTDETGDSLIKNNVTFSEICQSETGVEISKKESTGYDVVCKKYTSAPVSTQSCTKFCWGIPITAKEPEAAMRFLNLMYTDKDICNLLTWGIEGTDYVVKNGEACFPDGKDTSSVAYHSNDFLYGNQFLCYPWEGQGADFRTTAEESLKKAGTSKYFGFICDTSAITNELTATYNVTQQYATSLESGSASDLDSNYQEFISALKAAGVDSIVAEYQSQLDTWLSSQS